MKGIKKRAGLALAAIALGMALWGSPSCSAEKILSIAAWQEQAENLSNAEDYGKLAELYTAALAQYPTYTEFYLQRGEAWLYLGAVRKAEADFLKALALDDEWGRAVLGQAALRACRGEMKGAWEKYEQAKKLLGESPLFYLQRSKYYYQGIADYPHAFGDLEKALALAGEEEKPALHFEKLLAGYNYATSYDASYLDAVLSDGEALVSNENIPSLLKAQVYNLQADIHMQKGNYRQGLRCTQAALALSGDNAPLQAAIFRKQYHILHRMEMPKDERAALGAALKRNPAMPLPRKYEPSREVLSK